MHTPQPQLSTPPTWAAVQDRLREELTPLAFLTWFEVATGSVEAGADGLLTLQIASPTQLHTNWIKKEFLEAITRAWHHFASDGTIVFTEQPKPPPDRYLVPPEPEPEPGAVLLPAWADTRRAAASAVFRSALFPALARGHRRFVKRQKIFSTRGIDVFFTGELFDQSDLDVYLEILHLMRNQPGGTPRVRSLFTSC